MLKLNLCRKKGGPRFGRPFFPLSKIKAHLFSEATRPGKHLNVAGFKGRVRERDGKRQRDGEKKRERKKKNKNTRRGMR